MCNGNIGRDELDVRTCDGPHALLKLHGMCSRLQRLELSAAREYYSCHVDEPDVFRDEATQSLKP
jgi:hypothetical protein